jgi:TPR repeat protein
MRCVRCEQIIEPEWRVCPKCLCSFKNCENTTVDLLWQNIRKDVANFLQRDGLWQGGDFIESAAKQCVVDWKWADSLGWAEGHWFLARCYSQRLIRIPDTTGQQEAKMSEIKNLELCRLAASKGFPPAENEYGYCLLQGSGGLEKNPAEAFRLVKNAAEHGYPHAKYNLSSLYQYGHGVTKDEAMALQIHIQVAEQGFAPAQESLGTLYRIGRGGLPKNPNLAMNWYKKAAESGFSQAMCGVGALFYYGEGVRKNKKVAEMWFRKAAELNNTDALLMIEAERKKLFPWKF